MRRNKFRHKSLQRSGKSGQSRRKQMKKRGMAVFLSAVLLFGSTAGAAPSGAVASAEWVTKEDTATKPAVRKALKDTVFNRLKAYGNHVVSEVVDSVAEDIDEATNSSTTTEVVSWIRTWVLGKDSTDAQLSAINKKLDTIIDLCNDILDEMKKIEDEINTSLVEIEQMIANQNIATAKTNLENKWSEGDVGEPSNEFVKPALAQFKKYMQAAQDYNNDPSSSKKSIMDWEEKQYVDALENIYTAGGLVSFGRDVEDEMYTSYNVSDRITTSITNMMNNLCGESAQDITYADYAARLAYESMAFTGEQYDFIMQCINRQILQICYLEMMEQDFLGRQCSYLQENYPDNAGFWSAYDMELGKFGDANLNFAIEVNNRMDSALSFDPTSSATTHLYTYLTSEDEVDITAQYTKYEDRLSAVSSTPFCQRGVLNSDGTVTVYLFYVEEDVGKALTARHQTYAYTILSRAIHKNEISQTKTSTGTVLYNIEDVVSMGALDLIMYLMIERSDKWDLHPVSYPKIFDTNYYAACGSVPKTYLSRDEGLKKLLAKTDKLLISAGELEVGKQGTNFFDFQKVLETVDLTKAIPGGNLNTSGNVDKATVEWGETKDEPAEAKKLFEGAFLCCVRIDCSESGEDGTYLSSQELDSESIASGVKLDGGTDRLKNSANNTFTLSFPSQREGEDGKLVPIGIKAGYGITNEMDDPIYSASQTLVDFQQMQRLLDSNTEEEIELTFPVRYTRHSIYSVDYDYAVGDVKNLRVSANSAGNQATVSFDSISHASEAKIYLSADANFMGNVREETVKLNGSGVSQTYTLDSDMAGKRVYVMVQGYQERSYGNAYGKEATASVDTSGAQASLTHVSLTAPQTVSVQRTAEADDVTGFRYEICQDDTAIASKETEETAVEFTGLSDGMYTLKATPYTEKDGTKEYGDTEEKTINTGTPGVGNVLYDPFIFTDNSGEDGFLFADSKNTGTVDGVEMQFATDEDFSDPVSFVPDGRADALSGELSYLSCFQPGRQGVCYLRVRSYWDDPQTGERYYSGWSQTKKIDMANIPDGSLDLQGNADLVSGDGMVEASMDVSGGTRKAKAPLAIDGIGIKLTTDIKGRKIVANQYAAGGKILLSRHDDGSEFEKDRTYYAWISAFNFGDDTDEVILHSTSVGPIEVNPAHAHSYKTEAVKAAPNTNGSTADICSVCGHKTQEAVIHAPEAVKLSKTSYTYNGKAKKPAVTVEDTEGKELEAGTDYTVAYAKGRKNVGSYAVTVKLQDRYEGTMKASFEVKPKGTAISKVMAKKKGFTASWKKQSRQVTGYEIRYSTGSKFTKKATETARVKKNKTTTKAVSGLKAGKKYYVQIRTYKTVKANGKTVNIYSGWSKSKTVTTGK